MRKPIICVLLAVVAFCVVHFAFKVRDQVKRAKTYDTLSFILLTASRTLYAMNWTNGYNLVSETKRSFPELKIVDSNILDEWGNGIHIEIKTNGNIFNVNIISAGKDGAFGTLDDLIKSATFDKDK